MPQASAPETLYLVDAHSLIFQVFHAIRGMTSPTGVPTNALFGFVRDMLFLRSLDPTYLVCAFDRSEPTFRSEIYPDYKAHRSPMPDDLSLQIPLIKEALAALSIPVLSNPRYEADDILATAGRAPATSAASTCSSAPATRTAGSSSATASGSSTCASARSSAGPSCSPTGASPPNRWWTSRRSSATRSITSPACPASASRPPPSCCRTSARSKTSSPTSTRFPGPRSRRACAPAARS